MIDHKAMRMFRQSLHIADERIAKRRRADALEHLRATTRKWLGLPNHEFLNVDEGKVTRIAPKVVILPPDWAA